MVASPDWRARVQSYAAGKPATTDNNSIWNNVILTWPTNYTGFSLQSTTNLLH